MKKLLTIKETIQYLSISRATFWRILKTDKDFPKPIRISNKVLLFDIDDLNNYIEKKKNKQEQKDYATF